MVKKNVSKTYGRTRSGRLITDEVVEELAEKAEDGLTSLRSCGVELANRRWDRARHQSSRSVSIQS